MDVPYIEAGSILLLVVLSAVYSGMEIALVNISDVKLRARVESDEDLPAMLQRWYRAPNDVLATLLIGNNTVNILASALATDLTRRVLGETPYAGWAIPIAVGAMTLLVLVFGEVVPKTFAKHHSEAYMRLLPVVQLTDWLFFWLRMPLVWATQSILRTVNADTDGDKVRVTDEDIEEMVRMGRQDGSIDPHESRLLTGVLELDDKDARDIMVPRTDMIALTIDTPIDEVLERIQEAGFSRYPVYRDTIDQIVGVLYVKDLLSQIVQEGRDALTDLEQLLRPPMVVPETMLVPAVLVAMKRQRVHLAIVASEYGGVAGIVTLEDIVEEVFGPIYDEHDAEEEEFQPQSDGSWVIDGATTLRSLQEELGIEIHQEEDEEFETLAGLMMVAADGMPGVGFAHSRDGLHFRVSEADATRIIEVHIRRATSDEIEVAPPTDETPLEKTA